MPSNDAINARDDGIARAAEHADAVEPRWTDRAFDLLRAHAEQHTFFTIEQLRKAVAGQLPEPPTTRAWGAVVTRAMRAGIVKSEGWTTAEDPAVHCNLVTLWRSLLREDMGPRPDILRATTPLQALIEAAQPFAENVPENDQSSCHRGICSARECERCGRAYRLFLAIREVSHA